MSGKATLKSFSDILGTAKLPEKTVQICLRGDLVADFEELERQLEEAQEARDNSDSLDSGAEVAELSEKIEALRAEMKEETYSFRLRALSRRAYRALIAEHPPRKVVDTEGKESIHDSDGFGFNTDTLLEPLLRMALIDPELTSSQFDDLLDRLTDRQFDDLASAAWLLNRQEVDIPFSRAASRNSRSSEHE